MSFDALRALSLDISFGVMGVPATVTLSGQPAIETSVIWLSPVLIDVPIGNTLQRREERRVLAVSRADVPSLPRGTRIDAAEREGGVVQAWRVDEVDLSDPDHVRVVVIPNA